MPEHDDQEAGREPAFDSAGSEDHAQRLRRVSDSILAEVRTIRDLELEARALEVGSREFKRISAEITERSRAVFRMSGEQEALATDANEPGPAIEDLDTG